MSRTKIPKYRKSKKIMFKLTGEEKLLAEKLSFEQGENTSEFFRRLLKDEVDSRKLRSNMLIIEEQKKTMKAIKKLLAGEKQ